MGEHDPGPRVKVTQPHDGLLGNGMRFVHMKSKLAKLEIRFGDDWLFLPPKPKESLLFHLQAIFQDPVLGAAVDRNRNLRTEAQSLTAHGCRSIRTPFS